MTMSIEVAQLRITRDLKEAEAALDEALVCQAALLMTVVSARKETGSPPFKGHETLLRLNKSQQSLLASGGDLSRVHGQLLDIAREMSGGSHDCPDDWREPMGFEAADAA